MNHVTLRELVEWFFLSMFAIFSLGGFYIDHATKYAKHTGNDDCDDTDHEHVFGEWSEPSHDRQRRFCACSEYEFRDAEPVPADPDHFHTHDEEHQPQ